MFLSLKMEGKMKCEKILTEKECFVLKEINV